MELHWSKRVGFALLVLAFVVISGGVALWWLTHGDFGLAETLYFSLITVSIVGFSEPANLHQYAGARAVTAVLIVSGVVALVFFQSTMTTVLVEGIIGKTFRRRRMHRKLAGIRDHFIVAGCGRTGRFCIQELVALKRLLVVIDRDGPLLEKLNQEHYSDKLMYVVGDATEDHALTLAGVEHAKGLVAALTEDRDNLFAVLSARQLNPTLQIVAKALEPEKLDSALARRRTAAALVTGRDPDCFRNELAAAEVAVAVVADGKTLFFDVPQ